MSERDRAAVDVDAVLVDAEHPDRRDHDRRERLVDLPQVDLARLEAGLRERRARRQRRRAREVGEVVGGLRASRRSSRAAPCRWRCAHSSLATTIAPAPSLTPGELPAVWVPSLTKIAGSLASASSVVSRRGASSMLDDRLALARGDRHGDDLLRQRPVVDRGDRPLVRAQRPAVHVGARDLELGRDLGRLGRHVLARSRRSRGRRGASRRAASRRPSAARSARPPAGTARSTSTPSRRPARPRRRRRGSRCRAARPRAAPTRRPC